MASDEFKFFWSLTNAESTRFGASNCNERVSQKDEMMLEDQMKFEGRSSKLCSDQITLFDLKFGWHFDMVQDLNSYFLYKEYRNEV